MVRRSPDGTEQRFQLREHKIKAGDVTAHDSWGNHSSFQTRDSPKKHVRMCGKE